jgi:hypothetical protein
MKPEIEAAIVVPLSKRKVALIFLGSLAFVALSIWMWSNANDFQPRYPPLFVKAAALFAGAFFALCAIYSCVKFFDQRPGLIVDGDGIIDNSSGVAAGRIGWDEIVGLQVYQISRQRFLTILVSDPKKYADRGPFFTRMANAVNTRMTGSPINISSSTLGLNFDDLVEMLTATFEKCGKQGRGKGSR